MFKKYPQIKFQTNINISLYIGQYYIVQLYIILGLFNKSNSINILPKRI